MALIFDLPVYKLGYDLLLHIYQRVALFPKEHKYTMGERLKNEITEMLINIYKANKSKKETRIKYIEEARQNIEDVRLLLRIAKDLKVLGLKIFVALDVKVEELSKQLTSWSKYTAGAHIAD